MFPGAAGLAASACFSSVLAYASGFTLSRSQKDQGQVKTITPNPDWPKVKQKRLPMAPGSPTLPPCLLWVLFLASWQLLPSHLGRGSDLVSGVLVRPVFGKATWMDTPGRQRGSGVGTIHLLLAVLPLPNSHQPASSLAQWRHPAFPNKSPGALEGVFWVGFCWSSKVSSSTLQPLFCSDAGRLGLWHGGRPFPNISLVLACVPAPLSCGGSQGTGELIVSYSGWLDVL